MSLLETSLPATWYPVDRSSDLVGRLVAHIVEPPVLAQKAAGAIEAMTALPFVGLALREPSGLFAMHGVSGARHPALLRKIRVGVGRGLGGQAIALRRSVAVSDYRRDSKITADFLPLATLEGLRAMIAVPVVHADDVVGLLYGGGRGTELLGDRIRGELQGVAAALAPVVAAAVDHTVVVARQLAVERERIAQELHDNLGPILFATGVSARSIPDGGGAGIEQQVKEASRVLREALRTLGRQAPEDDLPVAARIDVDAFTQRSGVPAQLTVLGDPLALGDDDECVLLAVLRAALHNVEEHAGADVVAVTLRYGRDSVQLVVQDDGAGLPDGFVLRSRHGRDRGWGISSMLQRVQQHGGDLQVTSGEDGGTVVRAGLRVATRPHGHKSSLAGCP
jgi:signal transduction histidine kinase